VGKEFGTELRGELGVFLQGLGLSYKNFNKRKMLSIHSLHATPCDSIAHVQMAQPNVLEGKGLLTFSTPFTCCSKKKVSRLHQDQNTAWEPGSEQLSTQLCKCCVYLTH